MNSVKISPYVRIAKNNASYVSPKMRNLLLYFYFIRPANYCGPMPRLSIKSFVGFNMARDEERSLATSSLGRQPLLKMLAPLAKWSACSKSSPCLTVDSPPNSPTPP